MHNPGCTVCENWLTVTSRSRFLTDAGDAEVLPNEYERATSDDRVIAANRCLSRVGKRGSRRSGTESIFRCDDERSADPPTFRFRRLGPWRRHVRRLRWRSPDRCRSRNEIACVRNGLWFALWLLSPATNRHVLLRRREHQSLSSHFRKYKSRRLLKLPCDMALLTCEVDPRVLANTAPNMRRACKSL